MKKPRALIDAAISRLRYETQIPISQLAGEPITFPDGFTLESPSAAQVLRWGTAGMRGVFLDVLLCRKTAAWVTSRAAIDRFLKALADKQHAEMTAGREPHQAAT